jgi:hypothetical protein
MRQIKLAIYRRYTPDKIIPFIGAMRQIKFADKIDLNIFYSLK